MSNDLVFTAVLPAIAAFVVAVGLAASFLRRKTLPIGSGGVVEQYRLATSDRAGFSRVLLSLETANGVATYEFQPPYAYVLSNELLKVAAYAAPRSKPGAESILIQNGAFVDDDEHPRDVLGKLPPEGDL